MMYKKIKYLFDISFSLLLIFLLSPIFIVTAFLIKIKMGSPIFFTQERVGMNNTSFRIYKFRTMSNNNGKNLNDAQRVTSFGRTLRKFSIDEFPQLINILKGDMSFIGPRPLLREYLPYYTTREIKRHLVRPGMSGLAQVSGRSFLSWEEQFELDVIYVENLSLLMDLKIFIKTIPKVLGSADMMVTGRKDTLKFDDHRRSMPQHDK